mmetsp:Transcript_14368/g.26428  ORF Transcript_14368/g.26428 Transcript_14368/m.26428 type:complete len:98 (+) Transcript_14368:93-386(+)
MCWQLTSTLERVMGLAGIKFVKCVSRRASLLNCQSVADVGSYQYLVLLRIVAGGCHRSSSSRCQQKRGAWPAGSTTAMYGRRGISAQSADSQGSKLS